MRKIKVVTMSELRKHYSAQNLSEMLNCSRPRIYAMLEKNNAEIEWIGGIKTGHPVAISYPRKVHEQRYGKAV